MSCSCSLIPTQFLCLLPLSTGARVVAWLQLLASAAGVAAEATRFAVERREVLGDPFGGRVEHGWIAFIIVAGIVGN